MKRYLYIGLFAWVFLCLGCNREDRYLFSGEGTLRLDVRLDEEVTVVSRVETGTEGEDAGTDELKDKCRIRVYEGDKLVYKHSGWDETLGSEGLSLSSGVYRVRITSGDSVAASFDKKFYEGNEEFEINGKKYKYCCATVGNPHCVLPMKEVSEKLAREIGPVIENMTSLFPNRTNVQLLQVIDRNNIKIEIWERGAVFGGNNP